MWTMLPKYAIEVQSAVSFCGGGGGREGDTTLATGCCGALLEPFLMGLGAFDGDLIAVGAIEGELEGDEPG